MKKIIGILTVLCLLTVSILVAGESVGSTPTKNIMCTEMGDMASWTYMFYYTGDMTGNDPDKGMIDLDESMLEIINILELSGSTSKVNLLVQADDYKIWGGKKADSGSTRRYHIQHDDNLDELADYILNETVWYLKEQNMGDPNTLKDFINWATSNYPAEHYILILFGHGEGWIQICQDHSTGLLPPINYVNPDTSLSIVPDLKNVLSFCPHLDILFLYGCHMGQIEVFYELRKYADIIIATESYGAGSPTMFKNPVENLTLNPQLTSEEITQMIVDNYNPELFYNYDLFSPLFGIQTKYIDNIVKTFDNLTEALMDQYHSNPIKIYQMISMAFEHSTMHTTPKEDFYEPYAHELYEFAKEICNISKNKMPTIHNAALEVMSAIDNSSIIRHSEKTHEDYHGLAIFSPPRTRPNLKYYYTFPILMEIIPRNSYKSLDFAEDTQWDEILDIMYPLRRIILKTFNLD